MGKLEKRLNPEILQVLTHTIISVLQHYNICVVTDGFTSLRQVWVIGGQFLKSSADYFLVLRSLYDEGREKAPFFDKCDVELFTSNHPNPLLRINESFMKAINTKGYLPALIVLLLDEDIFMKPELYLPSEIEAHLRWIFDNINQTLKLRHRSMPLRCFLQGEPHVYVVKALPHSDIGQDPKIMLFQDRHDKYNNLLQAIGRCYAIGTINIHTIHADDARCFKQDDGSKLDAKGFYRLWRELLGTMNDIIREMDKEKRRKILQDEVALREHPTADYRHNRRY